MAETKRVLVYGATGAQGRPIVERLLAEGHSVRALSRAADISVSGAEPTGGDLDDIQSLVQATAGCERVVFLLPLAFDMERAARWTTNAVRAAEAAGVDLFVFNTSAPVPDVRPGVPAVDLKVEAERIVRSADVPSLIVRPTIYMGNLAAPWSAPGIMNDSIVSYPLPEDVLVAWISWEDTAAAITAALGRPNLAGQTFHIGGPEALDGEGTAAAVSQAVSKMCRYAAIPLPGFEAGLNGAFGSPVGTEIAKLYSWFAGEGRALLQPDASAMDTLGIRPKTLAAWAKAQDWRALALSA